MANSLKYRKAMGASYVNISLRGPAHADVLRQLLNRGRDAIVTPSRNGITVVYDRQCDAQDGEIIHDLTTDLSHWFHCPALSVVIHDDDILWYRLYCDGQLLDEYHSNPRQLRQDQSGDSAPIGGNAGTLCHEFQCPGATADAERILRETSFGRYAAATNRHRDLAALLGLPDCCVGTGFLDMNARPSLPEGCLDTLDGEGTKRTQD